jgi:hypothetical protein
MEIDHIVGSHRRKYAYHVDTLHSVLIAFSAQIVSVNILSGDFFISVFFKKVHGGVCRHEYSYHIAISHSALIEFSVKVLHWLKFNKGIYYSSVHQGIA